MQIVCYGDSFHGMQKIGFDISCKVSPKLHEMSKPIV